MNKQRFIDLITNSTEVSSTDLKDLEEVVKIFPYCQAAHILFAKASYETDNMLAEKRIRKAAAYSFDRKNLKKIIHHSKYSFKSENKSFNPIVQAPAPENLLEEKVLIEEIEEENIAISETANETSSIAEEEKAELISEPPSNDKAIVEDEKESPPQIKKAAPVETEKYSPPTGQVITNSKEFFEDLQKNLQDLRKLKEEAARDNSINTESKEEKPTSGPLPTVQPAVMPEKKYAFPEDKILEELSQKEAFKGKNKINIEKFPWEKVEIFLKKEEEKNAFLEKKIIEKNIDNEEISNNDADLHIQYLEFLDRGRKQLDKKQVENIIDKFIKEDPTIPPLNPRTIAEEQEDLSAKSGVESKGLISENFAKILIKQGKIQKAIDIYTQLSLKNPEKSTYFAGLINELKNEK
ncbi:MAG: hypothetical protein J7604_02845 [Sporocytophaga sp.]|uniref:hypothetical protein n=1 Tax=Sporocytophaga sp. TaxID=2231183 RepID=UPI001B2CE1B4|nr:hypothetical protein [Sporocytophaga sp.]MBO9699116.1 hypothetical protein [Sporocytophaga sp.]